MLGDGHYGTPEVMELLEKQGCGYIFGLSGNARLTKIGHPWCEDVAVRHDGKSALKRLFRAPMAENKMAMELNRPQNAAETQIRGKLGG